MLAELASTRRILQFGHAALTMSRSSAISRPHPEFPAPPPLPDRGIADVDSPSLSDPGPGAPHAARLKPIADHQFFFIEMTSVVMKAPFWGFRAGSTDELGKSAGQSVFGRHARRRTADGSCTNVQVARSITARRKRWRSRRNKNRARSRIARDKRRHRAWARSPEAWT